MEILDLLNTKFDNKYNYLRVLKVDYNTLFQNVEIWFLYPENIPDMTASEKHEISDYLDTVLDLSATTSYKFKRSFLDEDLIKKSLVEFLKDSYQSIFSYDISNYINIIRDDDKIDITIKVNSITLDYINSNDVLLDITKHLQKMFIAQFKVNTETDDSIKFNSLIIEEREKDFYNNLPKTQKIERYEVFDPVKVFGDDITPMPELIKNQKKERDSVIISGKVSNFKEGTYVSKRNKLKNIDEKSFYYSFTLTDHTGKMPAIYFSTKTNLSKIRNIKDGDSLLVVGNIKKGMKDLTIHIKSLSYCEIVVPDKKQCEQLSDDGLVSPEHIEEYKLIKPVAYECSTQTNLFEKPKVYNKEFLAKNYVVFDVETTGLNPETCEIIEIGSAKIINGKIVEKFQTLIKPHGIISDEITKLTGIDAEMVKDSPSGVDVIKDFYKFCEGCVIVGYNVSFDHAFLQNLAKKVGIKFPNETFDAMVLAKQKLYLPKYKLINVVEALGLDLHNAHRAYADALATAQVLQKLNEI